MQRRFFFAAFLVAAWACLGPAGAEGQVVWNGSNTKATGDTKGGDFNSNFWKVGTTLSLTPDVDDIAQIGANPQSGTENDTTEYLGLNLTAAFGLVQESDGSYVDQIGAIQVTSARTRELWIGIDKPAAGVAHPVFLQLNGATVGELDDVVIDVEDQPTATATGKPGVIFENAVGTAESSVTSSGDALSLRLGTSAVSTNNMFVVKAAAPTTQTGSASIDFEVPIVETVAGSSLNFRGGGTGAVAGAYMIMDGTNGVTGGMVLGNSAASSLADADGVVLEIFKAAAMGTGDVLVNSGSTLWLNGQSPITYGSAGQTLTLNGSGTASNAQLLAGATGALIVDATFPGRTISYVGRVVLASDSTVDVTGASGALALTGEIDGAGALVTTGPGTVQLSGANTYTGGTRINAGTTEAQSVNALGAAGGPIQIGSAGKLLVDAGIRLAQAQVGLSNGGTYAKAFNAVESLANFQQVRSDIGTTGGIAGGQAAAATTVTASFLVDTNGGSATGDFLRLSGTGGNVYALTLQVSPGASISIGEWNADSSLWQAAVAANTGNAADAGFFSGSFAEFEADKGVTDATLANYLGWYGADAATGQAWAVVNTDGDFAALATTPEPQVWAFLALGCGLLLVRLRGRVEVP